MSDPLREGVEALLRSEAATAVLYGVTGYSPDTYSGVNTAEALDYAGQFMEDLQALLDSTAPASSGGTIQP